MFLYKDQNLGPTSLLRRIKGNFFSILHKAMLPEAIDEIAKV